MSFVSEYFLPSAHFSYVQQTLVPEPSIFTGTVSGLPPPVIRLPVGLHAPS